MNRISRALALAAALTYAFVALPALAGTWVDDGASMLTPTVASQIDAKLASFTAQTHKQILVVTVPTTNGTPIAQAAQAMYAQRAVNGFLILVAKNDRRDIILPGRTEISSGWFSQASIADIQTTMQSSFKAGDFDGGITGAVNAILSVYRSHLGSLHGGVATVPRYANGASVSNVTSGGFHMPGWIWIVAILFIAYLVIRAIFRAIFGAAGRMMGGGAPMNPMGGGPMMGGPMGGYGGGGGSFWSGLLGGMGGAFIGNELFGNRGGMMGGNDMMGGPVDASQMGGNDGGGWGGDAGQSDLSGSAGGDWGGGGFGDSGGGGDFGGGDGGGGW